jgi:FMN reductase
MSATLNVVAVSGSLHAPSKTGALLTAITDAISRRIDSTVTLVEVNGLDFASDAAKSAVHTIEAADLLVVASPVYRASYTGAFKQLFDRVGQNGLVGTPVLLAATGGSDEHSLVIEHQFRPLFGFFHALSLPYGVYAKDADFTDGVATSPTLLASIDTAIDTGLPFILAGRGRHTT